MEKLVEVSEAEVVIDFVLGAKCRSTINLKSLVQTTPVVFRIQTSSPHKFHVNPPNGQIAPLSTASFQIILKPQTQIPPAFPRSPTDRFLIKTAVAPDCSSSCTTHATQDIKLKVYFVGPFLLRHAISNDDLNSVKQIVKKQGSIGTQQGLIEAAAVSRSAEMINLLCSLKLFEPFRGELLGVLESGDLALTAARKGDEKGLEMVLGKGLGVDRGDQYGLTALHIAAMKGHAGAVGRLVGFGLDVERGDGEGHTALHFAVESGHRETVELLIERGANVNARSDRGATPLHMAAAMGYCDIAKLLVEKGADPSCLPSSSSHCSLSSNLS